MFLNIHHRPLRLPPEPVVFFCRHCGHGSKRDGERIRKGSWAAHWGGEGCPDCGASTPPKRW